MKPKIETIIAFFIFISTCALYLFTGYGTVAPYRDSGDLASAAYSLGIPHPPGYVVYVLCGKIMVSLMPWGDAAYRLNMFSIICSAVTAVLLWKILGFFTRRLPAFTGTLVFVLLPAVWRLSQVTEMYSLNICIAAFIWWFILKENGCRKAVYITALVCGIGLANHQTIMFFFPGYAYLLWKKFPEIRNKENLISLLINALVFFLGGIALYLFLPVRSSVDPLMDWGDPSTIRNFWRMVSRSDYGLLKLHPEESVLSWNLKGIAAQLVFLGKTFIDQSGWVSAVLCMAGLWYAKRKNSAGVLLLLFVFSGPGFIVLANLPLDKETSLPILEPNLIMPGLIVACLVALGIQLCIERIKKFAVIVPAVLSSIVIFSAVSAALTHSIYNRDNFLSYDYGKNIFRSLEPGSILYNPDDPTTFITEYLKMVHGKRHDVRTIVYFRTLWGYHRLKKMYPDIMPQGEQNTAQEFLEQFFKKNIGVNPLYADLPFKFPEQYKTLPHGIVYKLRSNEQNDVKTFIQSAPILLSLYPLRLPRALKTHDGFFDKQIFSYYTSAYNNTGVDMLPLGALDQARYYYLKAIGLNTNFKESWNNLGALYYRRNQLDEAESYFRYVVSIDNKDTEGWYHVGLVLKKKNKYTEALNAFAQVQKEGIYGAYILNETGLIYLYQGNYDKAITELSRAIRINPSYILPYYNIGLAYQKKGDVKSALSAFQEYYNRVSDPAEKKETLAIINHLSK